MDSSKRTDHLKKQISSMLAGGRGLVLVCMLLPPVALRADDVDIYLTTPQTPLQANVLIAIDASARMAEGRLDRVKDALVGGLLNTDSRDAVRAALLAYTGDPPAQAGSDQDENEIPGPRIEILSDFFNTTDNNKRQQATAAVNRLSAAGLSATVEALRTAANWYEHGLSGAQEYPSPVLSVQDRPADNRCRSNSLILISAGQPDRAGSEIQQHYKDNLCDTDAPFSSDTAYYDQPGLCAQEIVQRLNNRDLMPQRSYPGWTGRQHVSSYTLGMQTADGSEPELFLKNLAYHGGGRYFAAQSAAEAGAAMKQFIELSNNAIAYSYTPPPIPFNPDRATVSGGFIYVPVFTPEVGTFWQGNLLKYSTGTDPQTGTFIRDRNGKDVIDSNYNFHSDLQDYWGKEGAAAVMKSAISTGTGRKLYTWIEGEDKNLTRLNGTSSISPNRVHPDNPLITTSMTGAATDAQRLEVLNWASWLATSVESEAAATADGMPMAAPLHTKPAVVQYPDNDDLVLINTTSGILHAFDAGDELPGGGSEEWAFIPQSLLSGLSELKRNDPSTIPAYGLDGPLITYTLTDQGVARKFAVFGMRRGGRSYFALDMSKRTAPRLAWQISGGETQGFDRLGQTWSPPLQVAMELNGGAAREVLVFGGGYDPAQDDITARADDNMGNAVYIVDAISGERLAYFSANTDSIPDGTSLQVDSMRNGIIGLQSVDINGNSIIDRLYAADTGGRIFRIDIPDSTFSDTSISAGLIADINAGSSKSKQFRRFFTTPEIAYYAQGSEQFLAILIGSGFPPDPFSNAVTDRFYMIKDKDVWQAPVDSNGNIQYSLITENELYDASKNLIQDGGISEIRQARTELAGKRGWFLDLLDGDVRQKVFAKAEIFNSIISFTVFQGQRNESVNLCTAVSSMGSQSLYAVRLLDGTAALDINKDKSINRADRSAALPSSGPPGSPLIISRPQEDDGSGNRVKQTLPGLEDVYRLPERFLPISWETIIDQYPPSSGSARPDRNENGNSE